MLTPGALSLFLVLSLCVSLCLSMFRSLSLYVSLCLSLCLSMSFYVSRSLSISLVLSLSLYVSLCFSLSFSLARSLSLCFSLTHTNALSSWLGLRLQDLDLRIGTLMSPHPFRVWGSVVGSHESVPLVVGAHGFKSKPVSLFTTFSNPIRFRPLQPLKINCDNECVVVRSGWLARVRNQVGSHKSVPREVVSYHKSVPR